ncbi:hypothetical protein niasHT_012020 [Heterodera trifolii]|uniref:Uncharacterized protein n=1 Tax=Heterodera trifolii TaxID=157864 RepID=A0ABD2KVC1_9BILA
MGTKNLEKVKAHLLCRTTEIMDIDFPEPFKTIFENGSKCHPSTSGNGGDRQKNKERHNGIENLIGKLMQNMCLNVNGKKKDKAKKHHGTEKAEDDVEEEENGEGKGREFHPSSSSSSKSKPKHVRHNSIDDVIDTLVKYHRICDMNKRKKKKNKKMEKGKAKKEESLMGGEGVMGVIEEEEEEEEEEESEEDEEADDRCFGCFH